MSFLACVDGKPHVFVNGATRHYYKRHYYKRHYYKRHYYKTMPEVTQTFVQPTLTANGTMGGNSFAVDSDSVYGNFQPWYAFRNKYVAREYFHSGNGQPHWLAFYNPNPLKISSLGIQNRGIDGSCLANYEIHASEDGNSWTTIQTGTMTNTALGANNTVTISNQNYYKYWRIKSLSCAGSNNTYWACSRVTITATEMTQVEHEIEVSEGEEYDRYEDVEVSEGESYSYYEDEEVAETDEYSFFRYEEVAETEGYDKQADILNTFGVEIK